MTQVLLSMDAAYTWTFTVVLTTKTYNRETKIIEWPRQKSTHSQENIQTICHH